MKKIQVDLSDFENVLIPDKDICKENSFDKFENKPSNRSKLIFAVDFDGTLCENKYPEIGEPKQEVINKCIELEKEGHRFILNTCRTDKELDAAIEWCKEKGIKFEAINHNLPDRMKLYENDCRKIGADYYVDDKNLSIDDFCNFIGKETLICPVCGNEMDETYRGTHYCKNCEEYLLR